MSKTCKTPKGRTTIAVTRSDHRSFVKLSDELGMVQYRLFGKLVSDKWRDINSRKSRPD